MVGRHVVGCVASLALAACRAPDVAITTDASLDVGIDTRPDGRFPVECGTHDEDGDSVPDLCDDCPGIPDELQLPGAPVGTACRAPPPFDKATARLAFNPFTHFEPADFLPFGLNVRTSPDQAFALDVTGDALIGGTSQDAALRGIVAKPLRDPATTRVVTVAWQPLFNELAVGIVVRGGAAPMTFDFCFVGGPRLPSGDTQAATFFGIARSKSGCGPSAACELDTVVTSKLPSELPLSVRGLRASITNGPTGVTMECRVFDPTHIETLAKTDPAWSVTQTLEGTSASGSQGLALAGLRAQFLWMDVLTD